METLVRWRDYYDSLVKNAGSVNGYYTVILVVDQGGVIKNFDRFLFPYSC